MIPREKRWLSVLSLWFLLLHTVNSQNARSYDTNDWIPITPSESAEAPKEKSAEEPQQKKATPRVLNIESPNQKFFPAEYEYRKGRPQGNPYLREGSFRTGPRPHKPVKLATDEYKYELPPPPQKPRPIKYLTQQVIAPPSPVAPVPQQTRYVEQRPLPVADHQQYYSPKLPPMPNVNPQVPAPNAPSLYEHYNIPFNQSFYQSLNPTRINQELLAIPQSPPEAAQSQSYQQPLQLGQTGTQKENSQLLYVPNQPAAQDSQAIYKQINAPQVEEKQYYQHQPEKQYLLDNIQQDYNAQALQSYKLQEQIQLGEPLFLQTTTTTPKPKKRKPHQPPLSVFMRGEQRADVSDVLEVLSEAKSIAVQDTIEPESPKIFIGPSNLNPTNGFVKFPLPYLNSLDGDRLERKIDNLPFFVAPLSYKTPPGYSKIRLPSPHVGSVVISHRDELHGKTLTQKPIHYEQPNEISQFKYTPSSSPQSGYNTASSQGTAPVLGNPGNTVTADLINKSNEIIRNAEKFQLSRGKHYSTSTTSETPQLIAYQAQQDTTNTKPEIHAFYPSQTLQEQQKYYLNHDADLPSQEKPYTFKQKDEEYQHQYDFSQQPYKLPLLDANHIPTVPKTIEQSSFKLEAEKPTQSYESLTRNKAENADINPLELAINEYELHQINSELVEPNKKVVKHSNNIRYRPENDRRVLSSTNKNIFSDEYELPKTTPKSERAQQRRRGRPTRPTTAKPSESITNDRYTVLEEFNIQQPSSTENYLSKEPESTTKKTSFRPDEYTQRVTEIEEIPSSVYRLNLDEDRIPQYETTKEGFRSTTVLPYRDESKSQAQGQENYSVSPLKQSLTETRQPTYEYLQPSAVAQLYLDDNYNTKSVTPKFTEITQQNNQQYFRQQDLSQQGLFETTPNIRTETGLGVSLDEYTNPQDTRTQNNFRAETQPSSETRGQYQIENLSPTTSSTYQDADDHYANLQDQAVRSLLIPRLLVPTTKQKHTTTKAEISQPPETTQQIITHLVTTPVPFVETTTRAQRTRGRQRTSTTNNRQQTSSSGSTSTPRRGAGRRRPVQRTTTERTASKEYASREDTEVRRTVAANKQRFRTKSRPLQDENILIDRISTTERDIKIFKEPLLEGGFEAAAAPLKPSSYMQFDHTIEELDIVTLKPEQNIESAAREYHQVYSLSSQPPTTENPRFSIQYENTGSTLHQPVVDVQITHPIQKLSKQVSEPDIITKPTKDEQYVRYNTNIQSGGVLRNNKNTDDSPRTTPRTRTRTRGRSRFATSPATTSAVTAISSTTRRPASSTTQRQLTKQEREEEFFGFIRAPNFAKPLIEIQPVKEQPQQEAYASRQITTTNTEREPDVQSVRFVGEIRPKYRVSTQKTVTEAETDATRTRQRGRIRIPARKTAKEQDSRGTADNDVYSSTTSEQITRRSSDIRSRGRGTTHFKLPENLKKTSGDEDVEGGNYPAQFLEKRELITAKPNTFQITVEPVSESEEEDQSPHPSIYSAHIVPTPENWTEASGVFSVNQITDDISKVQKKEFNNRDIDDENLNTETKDSGSNLDDSLPNSENDQIRNEQIGSTERLVATSTDSDEIVRQITEAVEDMSSKLEKIGSSTRTPTEEPISQPKRPKKGRRKGVWKLVRQQPLDPFETAESQNYQTVLNNFETIIKISPYDRVKTNNVLTQQGDLYTKNENENIKSFTESQLIEEITTEMIHIVKENNNLEDNQESSKENNFNSAMEETTLSPIEISTTSTTEKPSNSDNTFFDTIYEMFGGTTEQAESTTTVTSVESKTSTTTDEPKITANSPTFPEEITEVPLVSEAQFTTFPATTQGPEPETTQNVNITQPVETTVRAYEVEPWEMKAVKTSTSTEVSHETEICYKGRCVKSRDFVRRL